MADNKNNKENSKADEHQTPEFKNNYGENAYWLPQTGDATINGCTEDTCAALYDLSKWFFEKTGKRLVLTAGTNGIHARADNGHDHANGWKLDVIDWGGPENLQSQFFGDNLNTQLANEFIEYGHSLGLGMNIEAPNTDTTHFDIATDGYEWTSGQNQGGYNNRDGTHSTKPIGAIASSNRSSNSFANAQRFRISKSTVTLMPNQKTYCEPVYPDLIYVQGNIPNSVVEDVATNNTAQLDPADKDFQLLSSKNTQNLLGIDGNAFTTKAAQDFAQKAFDPSKAILEMKTPSAGRPLNNNDPFPIDLKIEELELHRPRVKHYSLSYDPKIGCTLEHAKAILEISDSTEKRIVKLENMLATVMRYTFAIGSRMHVNCQYWGGTDHRSKYTCIRCLKDNRCADGQVMQLDQCLSCSRYEPIIGQTYDILSNVGANLANIQDDIQAGYMNMEDYLDFTRVEKMHKKKEEYAMNYTNINNRNTNEKDFKDIWDEGIKMNWQTVPVENQKPQINWRADINHADKSPTKLGTYQTNNGQGGDGINAGNSLRAGTIADWMQAHYDDMQRTLKIDVLDNNGDNQGSLNNEEKELIKLAQAAITEGFSVASDELINQAIENLTSEAYEQNLQNACKDAGNFDPVLLFSFAVLASKGDAAIQINSNGGGLFNLPSYSGDGTVNSQCAAAISYYNKMKTQYFDSAKESASDNSVIEKGIEIAIQIANDNSIGYSQETRYGNPNYDCTSFISGSLSKAGLGCGFLGGDSFDTELQQFGFKSIPWSDGRMNELKRGDILSNPNHVEWYIGNGQVVGAHGAIGKELADQISVTNYFDDNWTNILRPTNVIGTSGTGLQPFNNPIIPSQAIKGWNDNLSKIVSKGQTFDGHFVKAILSSSNADENKRWFPALVQTYLKVAEKHSSLSQLTSTNTGGPEFPIATADLTELYFVQNYGTSNASNNGVAVVSNAIGFKCSAGLTVYCPMDSTITIGEDETLGKFVSITDRSSKECAILGQLSSISAQNGVGYKKGAAIALTSDRFIMKWKDENGKYINPTIRFARMNKVGLSSTESVGKQMEVVG